jgi:hypothetical protein
MKHLEWMDNLEDIYFRITEELNDQHLLLDIRQLSCVTKKIIIGLSQIGATNAHRLTTLSSARISCITTAIIVMTLRIKASTAGLLNHFPTT